MTWTSDLVSLSTWPKETLNLKMVLYRVLGSPAGRAYGKGHCGSGLGSFSSYKCLPPPNERIFLSAGPTSIRGRPRVTRKYRERMCAQISGVGELSSATALLCVWLLLPIQALGLPS